MERETTALFVFFTLLELLSASPRIGPHQILTILPDSESYQRVRHPTGVNVTTDGVVFTTDEIEVSSENFVVEYTSANGKRISHDLTKDLRPNTHLMNAPYTAIVCDESSTLTLDTLYKDLKKVPVGTTVKLLKGDANNFDLNQDTVDQDTEIHWIPHSSSHQVCWTVIQIQFPSLEREHAFLVVHTQPCRDRTSEKQTKPSKLPVVKHASHHRVKRDLREDKVMVVNSESTGDLFL